jgi:hypothetical protein
LKQLVKYTIRVSIFLMFTLFCFISKAQGEEGYSNDNQVFSRGSIMKSDKKSTVHSPRKATILSAILPGAGQVYNKKLWKVPFVYGAIGSCLYFAINNNVEYNKYFGEQVYRAKFPGYTLNPDFTLFSDANLSEQADYHRKWRDNFFVFTAIAYGLNVIDANVDANLFNFDVSSDLSLNVSPYTDYSLALNAPVGGVSLKLTFK